MSLTAFIERLAGREGAAQDGAAQVREALIKWKDAVRYFESVNDPDLIDYAIYDMEAARRRYVFLLKRAGGADR